MIEGKGVELRKSDAPTPMSARHDELPPAGERPPRKTVEPLRVVIAHAWHRTRPGHVSLRVAGGLLVIACVAVAVPQRSVGIGLLRGVMTALVALCALIDIDRRKIPNRITGPGALLAVLLGTAVAFDSEPRRLLAGLAAGGFLLVMAMVRPEGMGMGDVKMLGMIGLFVGPAVAITLMIAVIGSVLTGVLLAPRRGIRAARKTALPFGPYLAAGAVLAAFVGDPLLHAYLHPH